MLLERGMAKEALAAFEATLKKAPNRLGATLGVAAAAEQSGDSARRERITPPPPPSPSRRMRIRQTADRACPRGRREEYSLGRERA